MPQTTRLLMMPSSLPLRHTRCRDDDDAELIRRCLRVARLLLPMLIDDAADYYVAAAVIAADADARLILSPRRRTIYCHSSRMQALF